MIARAVSLDTPGLGGGGAFPARPACFLSSETEQERLSEGCPHRTSASVLVHWLHSPELVFLWRISYTYNFFFI